MKKTLIVLAALLPFAAHALTVDELVTKNLAARGGAEKLRAIKTARWTGKLRINGGGGQVEGDYSVVAKAPGRILTSVTVQGFENVYAHDGKLGWKVEPGGGRRDAVRLSSDDAKGMVESSAFAGLLLDWKARGFKLDYLGTDDVDGTGAHKLKVTQPDKDFHYVFLDPDHFLEIRQETHRWVRGAEQVEQSDFGEYETVEGSVWPFLIASGAKGAPAGAVALIEKLELNVPVDDALFRIRP